MPISITDANLADFLDECGWATSTRSKAVHILARWETWLRSSDVAVIEADQRHLRAYLDQRTAGTTGLTHGLSFEPLGPVSAVTLHKDWQTIVEFYAWAAREIPKTRKDRPGAGMLTCNPMLRVASPEIPETLQARIATPELAHALETHFARKAARREQGGQRERALRNAAMVSLMIRSGLRSSDIVGLDLHHLVRDDRDELVAVVVGGDDGMRAKNRRQRMAPICDETPALLAKYLRVRGDGPGPLFLGRERHTAASDRRLKSRAVQDVVRRAATACRVEVSAHDLRRGWAVTSARRGVDRGWIKAAGGWGNDQMLDLYLGKEKGRVAVEAFRAAIGDTHTRRAG